MPELEAVLNCSNTPSVINKRNSQDLDFELPNKYYLNLTIITFHLLTVKASVSCLNFCLKVIHYPSTIEAPREDATHP